MKKRLLSAALALAMVLTLLPVSAFAATITTDYNGTIPNGKLVNGASGCQYFGMGQLNASYGMNQPGWYYFDNTSDKDTHTYYPVTTGVVTSGNTWYENAATAVGNGQYNFTLMADDTSLQSATAAIGSPSSVSLNVDLNGKSLTLPATMPNNVTSLTLTDPHLYDRDPSGVNKGKAVNGISKTNSTTGFTLSATNVEIAGSIELSGQRNSVTLNNATLSGSNSGITLNGTTTTNGTTTYVGQTLQTSNGTTIAGAVAITGDSNTIMLANTTVSGGTFTVSASGGTIQISDNSVLPTVTVTPRANQPVTSALPAVTVSGSTVHTLQRIADPANTTAGTGNSQLNSFTVSNSTILSGIKTTYGTVSVTSSNVQGEISVGGGTLALNGANHTGKLTLGTDSASTVVLTITGTNNTIGAGTDGIVKNAGTLTLTVPADPNNGNQWGKITDTTNQAINKITGGTFAGKVPANWLVVTGNDARVFELKVGTTPKYTYHSQAQLGDVLTTQQLDTTNNELVYVPHRNMAASGGTGPAQSIEFYSGTTLLGTVKGNGFVPITLPSKVADQNTPAWFYGQVSYNAGASFTSPADTTVKLETQPANSEVTKLTDVAATTANVRDNVKAVLTQTSNGGTITLSGGVNSTGSTNISLNLTTDMVLQTTSGSTTTAGPVVLENVGVVFESSTGAVTFVAGQDFTDKGVTFRATSKGLTILHLSNGNEYTLANGGITVIQSDLKIASIETGDTTGKAVSATVNISGLGQAGQTALKAKIENGAEFDWTTSPALRQAVNAAAAKITASQITQWKTAAQQAAWRTKYSSTATAAQLAATGYDQVWLVPYLAMTVTQQSDDGTMTATLVPSFRVEVRQSSAPNDWKNVFTNLNRTNPSQYPFVDRYVAQQGQSLGALTGDFGTASLKLGTALQTTYANTYLHQDSKYVYAVTSNAYTILNAGTTGLGSIVINKVASTVDLERKANSNGNSSNSALTLGYDNLQTAVDQTLKQTNEGGTDNRDVITIKQAYKGSTTIDVTGEAREFIVNTQGNHSLSAANNNFTVTPQTTGKTWTVQLAKDTAKPTTPTGDVTITVASVTNGRASVSASKAKAGDTITVTSTPNTGYAAGGLTIRTDTGASVSYTTTGTNATTRVATYTFKVPEGAKSITVTPAFAAANTGATVTVSNTSYGTATTSAGSNRVAPGSTVSVTTSPSSGYRTMGLYVTANSGSATAVRTGANSFTFTVPSNATNVVVTPRFDVNNGTLFEDVWSTEYFSSAVAWAVGRGVTNGTSTYTFGSYNSCTRADMVTFLYRAAGSPTVSNVANPFWDVQPGAYYYNAVLWAVSKGITNGVSANQFGVSQYVTRAQAVTFLYRYNGSPAASTYSGFYDVPASEYYAKAVAWAKASGVTDGTSATLFSPSQAVSRAQAVTFLYRNATGVRT